MRKKNICVTRLDKDKVAYLFFKIFIKQTKIVHLYSKRSSFSNHSAVFAILFIVKFSDFTTQQHGRRSLAGVCRQLSARPPNIKGVSLLVRFPILWHCCSIVGRDFKKDDHLRIPINASMYHKSVGFN